MPVANMKTHELKCWPQYFDAVWDGKKKFELRINDRDFKVGDILILKKFDPEKEEYLPQSIETTITYILEGPSFGLAKGFAIISFDQIKHFNHQPVKLTKEDIERIREEGVAFGKEISEIAKAMQLTSEDWRTVVK
jgi:hypothetical protein